MPTPDAGELAVRLLAEDVSISRRSVAGETRRVKTVTHERVQHIDVDLTHVRVEVKRVAIGRPVDAVPPIREEGETTIVSVVEEIIVIERRFILKEEVHVTRVRVTERRRENVVVREQTVEISSVGADSPAHGDDGDRLTATP